MKSRSNLVITIAALCHLLLLPGLVTSQLPSPSSSNASPQECTVYTFTKPAPGRAREPVTIKAGQCEKLENLYKLHGSAEIDYRNYIIRADEMTYNEDSGEATGTGNVRLNGGEYDIHVEASHATYSVQSATGRFYDVFGTTGMRPKGKHVLLTTSNPFAFTGKWVEKVSATRLIVHHGTVTSCQTPKPKWTFNAARVVIDIGGEAKIFNGTFRVKGVPTLSYALTQSRVIWHYLRLLVLPTGLNLDYDFPLSTSLLTPPSTLLAVLSLAALLGAAWHFSHAANAQLLPLGQLLRRN